MRPSDRRDATMHHAGEARPLVIRLMSGDITRVRASLIVVNHFNGLPPSGAEAAIDEALGGVISWRAARGRSTCTSEPRPSSPRSTRTWQRPPFWSSAWETPGGSRWGGSRKSARRSCRRSPRPGSARLPPSFMALDRPTSVPVRPRIGWWKGSSTR